MTIALFMVYILFVFNGMSAKGCDGLRKSDAHSVTVFTKQISTLLAEGKHQRAKELLDKFNEEYPALATHDEMTKEFMDKLGKEAQK